MDFNVPVDSNYFLGFVPAIPTIQEMNLVRILVLIILILIVIFGGSKTWNNITRVAALAGFIGVLFNFVSF